MRILILIEPSETGFSAYAPDVPGCAATAATREATELLMQEALKLHFEALRDDGQPVPEVTSYATYVDVAVPA
jgi:predicted RNase H-like HicB family nuclease